MRLPVRFTGTTSKCFTVLRHAAVGMGWGNPEGALRSALFNYIFCMIDNSLVTGDLKNR